jgi:hypothetical protein
LPRFAAQQAPAAEPDAGLCSASAGEQQSLRRQSVLLVRNSRRLDRRSPGFCSPPVAATSVVPSRRPVLVRCGSQGREVRPEYRLSHPQGKRASRRREIDHARSRSGPVLWWGWVARPDTAGVGGMDGSARRGILLSQRPWSPDWLGVSDGVGAGVCRGRAVYFVL